MRKWNFCAGPAVISEEVLTEVRDELLEWGGSGMSIMEMSHRSNIYDKVAADAKNCLLYTSPSPRDLSTSRMPSSA